MQDRMDALIAARQERQSLWDAVRARQISQAEFYDRVMHLRETWGDALYERPSRR